MENVFELFSNLSDSKFLQNALANDVRNIFYKWKIVTESITPASLMDEPNSKENEDDDEFYKEIDDLIAKAQESIKIDYNNVNKKSSYFF